SEAARSLPALFPHQKPIPFASLFVVVLVFVPVLVPVFVLVSVSVFVLVVFLEAGTLWKSRSNQDSATGVCVFVALLVGRVLAFVVVFVLYPLPFVGKLQQSAATAVVCLSVFVLACVFALACISVYAVLLPSVLQ